MTNRKDIIKKKKGEVVKEAKITSTRKSMNSELSSKKGAVVVIGISTLIILIIALTALWLDSDAPINVNVETFKEYFEKYNHKKNKDGEEYPEVKIDKNNIVQYAEYEKLFSILEKGTGVLYFGSPESFSDRKVLSYLLEISDEVGLDVIYYKDISKDKEENTKDYQKLLGHFNFFSVDCIETDCIGIENFVPTVVFVKEGKITFIYDDNSFIEYNESLKDMFTSKMNELITCNDAC